MDSFSELARLRRSMRKFTEEKVSTEQQRQLMRVALMAPSSKGMHSCEFIMVEDPQKLSALAASKAMGSDFLAAAPLAAVVLADPAQSDVWIEDASVAATTLLYQAEDMGLGACWIQVRERQDAEGRDTESIVKDLLGIDAHKRVVCIVAIGHKGMERKPQNEDRLRWDKVSSETLIF